MDPYSWSWGVEGLLAVPAMTAGYVVLARRRPPGPLRIACFLAAMALLLAVSITPLETIALHYLLSIHLLQNVVLAEWAPALVVAAVPPALAAALPRVPPVPVLLLWVVNYMAWHLPWAYDAALRHPHTLLHLEHALYFVTGILLWWPIVHGVHGAGVKATYVFAAFALASPIGLLLALLPEPIYDFYADVPRRLWGFDPLLDQQIAGVTMALEQAFVFFAVFAFYFVRFLREQDAQGQAEDRAAGRA